MINHKIVCWKILNIKTKKMLLYMLSVFYVVFWFVCF